MDADEALLILRAAKAAGVKRLIVTHPMFLPQYTYMSLEQLRASVDLGASSRSPRAPSPRRTGQVRAIEAIKALGTQNVFVSSDSGLVGTPNHPDALATAAKALRAAEFSEQDLNRMFKETPARLVGL